MRLMFECVSRPVASSNTSKQEKRKRKKEHKSVASVREAVCLMSVDISACLVSISNLFFSSLSGRPWEC